MDEEREGTSNQPASIQVIGRALRDWWDDWINMALVNLLWAVGWLTIILGPPATLGLYYVTNQLAHGKSVGLRGLFEGGRLYFFTAWRWALLNLVVAATIGANYLFYGRLPPTWGLVVQSIFLGLGILWLVVQFYALPYLMEQKEQRLRLALRNGLYTMLAAPGYTLVLFVVVTAVLVFSVGSLIFLFLGGPCLAAAIGNRAVIERLETYGVREREAAKGE